MYAEIDNVRVWGIKEEGIIEQMHLSKKDAVGMALMADHHIGYSVPIGGVVVYDNQISPSGVGFDIACGNKAVRLDADANDVRKNISKIMDDIVAQISFGVGRNNSEEVDHPLFNDPLWSTQPLFSLKRKAALQLGTVGSGNHYVDIFVDESDQVWVGVHFGSRGLGHTIATHFINAGGGKDGMMVEPVVLNLSSDLGAHYHECMKLAGEYAYAGRDWVCSKVASIIGANIIGEVHNHHNFAWQESHGNEKKIVVRKGATPCWPGQLGFVGGSMAENSYIIEGVLSDEAAASYYSTVHGAGRVLGRRKAAGKMKWVRNPETGRKAQLQVTGGLISREMMNEWVNRAGVELRGAGTDESPHCYKRLNEVLEFHPYTKILHTLTPIGVAMAGEGEIDPYKD